MFASRGQKDRSRAAECVRTDRTEHFGGRGATMRSAVQPSVSPLLASRAVALATPVHVEPLRNNRTPCAGRASAPPMQKYCTELTEKLLKSLDKEYNVIDMGAVVEVISTLEKTAITKEVLEITRLGKFINELRRKTNNESLARRAKNLVRRWRDMLLPTAHSPQPTVADMAPALNGAKPHSPALQSLKTQSPALRGVKPQSPLLKNATNLRVSSPALSAYSDNSRSPSESQRLPTSAGTTLVSATTNHRTNSVNSSEPSEDRNSKVQNHSSEAVPRTHSSNKRLRKDEPLAKSAHEIPAKKARLNGESLNDNISSGLNSQVPNPATAFVSPDPSEDDAGLKKRGRKKGSKSFKKQCPEDSVKEKLASISRTPKLKTTQELLADLQARGSNTLPSHSINTPNVEVVLRNADAANKYSRNANNNLSHNSETSQSRLKQDNDAHSDYLSENKRISSNVEEKSAEVSEKPSYLLTVEEILAKLPPLDLDAIDWGSDEEPEDVAEKRAQRKTTPEDIDRLHTECLEGQNGNFMPRELLSTLPQVEEPETSDSVSCRTASQVVPQLTCPSLCRRGDDKSDIVFREYHEMLARYSHDRILHILPYVVVD